MSICSVLFVTGNIRMTWDILMFTRLKWGNKYTNIAPQTLTPPSRVRSGPWTQATTQAPNSGPHTASLSSSQAQPLCWSEAKKYPCFTGPALCIYRVTLCSTQQHMHIFQHGKLRQHNLSQSAHTSVLFKSEWGNQGAQEWAQHRALIAGSLLLADSFTHLKDLKNKKQAVGKKHKNKMRIIQLLATWMAKSNWQICFFVS